MFQCWSKFPWTGISHPSACFPLWLAADLRLGIVYILLVRSEVCSFTSLLFSIHVRLRVAVSLGHGLQRDVSFKAAHLVSVFTSISLSKADIALQGSYPAQNSHSLVKLRERKLALQLPLSTQRILT